MVHHAAVGVGAAAARARVDALLVAAGLVERAVGVCDTLGGAAVQRVTEVGGQTDADGHTLALRALRVVAARGRLTRVDVDVGPRSRGFCGGGDDGNKQMSKAANWEDDGNLESHTMQFSVSMQCKFAKE